MNGGAVERGGKWSGGGAHLDLEELLEADHVRLRGVVERLALRLEHEAGGERMPVLALCAVWALPEPAEPWRRRGSARRWQEEAETHFWDSMASMKNLQTI